MKKIIAAFLFLGPLSMSAQNIEILKSNAIKSLDMQYDGYKKIAHQIWDFAEVGYKEVKSTELLQNTLKNGGFKVESGVAGMPTAFVATFGEGKPVIGILAEFDALPGLAHAGH
jgi:aminobenzoyl-glutamate utilization protein B